MSDANACASGDGRLAEFLRHAAGILVITLLVFGLSPWIDDRAKAVAGSLALGAGLAASAALVLGRARGTGGVLAGFGFGSFVKLTALVAAWAILGRDESKWPLLHMIGALLLQYVWTCRAFHVSSAIGK